ncbi:putative DNA-directed RNA polymerase III subunit rpc6 [Psilocybe cubensis]|uniref:DNA-directed RNA polymerase III subunit rpc6 n=2 Tax=Psilocybe cubensis TaxID=181762 RepID=A0ACB8H3Y5_PSICU|nr:putative DNA-directed RNA polymerase III subunit rpc6 [Psilocybe cubensis]KAH9482618.1 putative DNA-directed RNA polymerase III subunit rpc6 [Psilocybe cubensis]
MSKRPPNEQESRLHQAALASSKKELTARQAESIIPDPAARQQALNFLLGVGLLKGLTNSSGQLSFRAVSKEEIVATKGLTGEENLVLSHIKSSGNEGIWTKHLKAKTSLHQTVIERCLKTLTQKRLIKRVPSVQHITRKIYMLEGIEPSISLTGGPWYTDNELDTEFIQNLTEACYKLISDISFPKRRNGSENALYPISNAPRYPTAENIRHSLRKARLTETDLSVEHVEMLLNVLILDGKIEKIPAFGSALWNSEAIGDGDSGDEEKSSRKKKRKKRDDDSDDEDLKTKKKRKKLAISDDEIESSDEESSKKKKKKKKSKTKSTDSDSDSETEKKKKKKKKRAHSSSSESSSEDEARHRKKSKKKQKHVSESESSSEDTDSESRRKKHKSSKRSETPNADFDAFDTSSGGSVYRALKEHVASIGLLESPCGLCPSFEFCKQDGPVNPKECVYYGDWLAARTIVNNEDS